MTAALFAVLIAAGCATDEPERADSAGASPATRATGAAEQGPTSSSSPQSSPRSSPSSRPNSPQSSSPSAPPAAPPTTPPFIASATWADSEYGATLKVAPTTSGRHAWGPGDATAAWQEVLRVAPDADTPGMWEQFDCHWTWARILEPDKPTWNLEPWRPVVSAERMLAEGCNPGGPEV